MAVGEAQCKRVMGKCRRLHAVIGRDRGLGPVRFLAFGLQRRFVGREIIVAVIASDSMGTALARVKIISWLNLGEVELAAISVHARGCARRSLPAML